MDRQAGFLLALLFLANFLTIEADDASGPASDQPIIGIKVELGKPWKATCTGLDGEGKGPVEWTHNGFSIGSEFKDGELTVSNTTGTSTIAAAAAKEGHTGLYKCTPDSEEIYLIVLRESPPVVSKAALTVPSNTTNNSNFGELFALAVNATLNCTTKSDESVQWQKDNKTLVPNDDHYELLYKGNTIFFKKAVTTLLGNYSCRQGNSSKVLKTYQVIEMPAVALAPNSSVVEGEKLSLTCEFSDTAYSPASLIASITWTFNGTDYTTSKDRVKLTRDESQGLDNAKITIANMNMNDHSKISGPITCTATYKAITGEPSSTGVTYLVVKDKLAALWPFLGICLEVVVLCAIILVYEKKRNKAELEESDTDQSPDTKPTPNKDSEVRHRK